MKETGDSNAPFFGLPEGLNGVKPHAKAFYGSTPVPHPTNEKAKMVNAARVMAAVNEGK
jgi:hypothetical protein